MLLLASLRTTALAALLLATSLTIPATLAAQSQDLGTVKPRAQYTTSSIAVLPFNVTNSAVEIETLPRIIRNDLELSGFFSMPKNQTEANRQLLREDAQRTVQFEAWQQLGIDFTLRGYLQEEDGNFKLHVRLHSIKDQRLLIDRVFTGRKAALRDLAHQVSDQAVKFVTGIDGVARTKILFAAQKVPSVTEIGIMDWDGFNARPLTELGKLATFPDWGANGTEFYFTSWHGNRPNIYGMQLLPDAALNFSPGQRWDIAKYGGTNSLPAWSSAAGRIAMVLSKDGNSEIYTTKRDGSDLQRVTTTAFDEGSPTWSPDGTKIAFTSNDAGGAHIFMMNADGSNRKRVTRRGAWNDAVKWSPKGDRFVFVSRIGGVNDIFVCRVDGGDSTYERLTMNQGQNESPSWAPNSTHITFSSTRSGLPQIYIMLDDGSNQRQLTTTGRNTVPDWGPLFDR